MLNAADTLAFALAPFLATAFVLVTNLKALLGERLGDGCGNGRESTTSAAGAPDFFRGINSGRMLGKTPPDAIVTCFSS